MHRGRTFKPMSGHGKNRLIGRADDRMRGQLIIIV